MSDCETGSVITVAACTSPSSVAVAPSIQPSYDSSRQPLTRSELLEALDRQIEMIERSNRKPGWNTWALAGSAATGLWIMLDLIQEGPIQIPMAGVILLAVSLTVTAITLLSGLLGDIPTENSSGRFKPIPREICPRTLFLIITDIALLFICIYYLPLYSTRLAYATGFYILLDLLMTGFVTVITTRRFYIPASITNRHLLKVTLSLLGIWLSPILYWHWKLILSLPSIRLQDFRIAVLASAIVGVSSLLLRSTAISPLLQSLNTVADELSFGRISLADAHDRADTLMRGLTLDKVLQKDIAKYYRTMDLVFGCVEEINAELGRVSSTCRLFSSGSSNNSEQQSRWISICEEIPAKLTQRIADVNELQKSMKSDIARIARQLKLYTSFDKESIPDSKIILHSIVTSLDECIARFTNIESKTNAVLKEIAAVIELHSVHSN